MKPLATMQPDPMADPHLDLMRAVRLCHPAWDALGRVTLFPDAAADGFAWRERVFHPVIQPRLEAAFRAACQSDASTLAAEDLALEAALSESAAAASRRAGLALLEKFPAPPGERLWHRHARQVLSGTSPGHLAMVVAVRAAAFHLPPPVLLASYVFLEARAGLPGRGLTVWMKLAEAARPSASTPQIRAA